MRDGQYDHNRTSKLNKTEFNLAGIYRMAKSALLKIIQDCSLFPSTVFFLHCGGSVRAVGAHTDADGFTRPHPLTAAGRCVGEGLDLHS